MVGIESVGLKVQELIRTQGVEAHSYRLDSFTHVLTASLLAAKKYLSTNPMTSNIRKVATLGSDVYSEYLLEAGVEGSHKPLVVG